ncbi:MAG TPA: ATP-binding cassette domain-containing protein [Armatimonadetes bacterium]|nr:ATP-binding cassette domain-containing protein [Armatimonadota bacterium]
MCYPVVIVENLQKHFRVHVRGAGWLQALQSLILRRYRIVRAVDGISFTIYRGEIVGFLGPNGAGKTTTLKILAGLLYPTGGTVRVLGHVPQRRECAFLRNITFVMGQKSQLVWDLPPLESFMLHKALYEIPEQLFKESLDELIALLELSPLLAKPVRQLSLGERMRCELALALLHRPQVLFLDEPTLGLDVVAQAQIRNFIRDYNRRHNATVLLTSHYMDDVTALCERVLVVNDGKLVYDGRLDALLERYAPYKFITAILDGAQPDIPLEEFGELVERSGQRVIWRVPRKTTSQCAAHLLKHLHIRDITIEEPPIEDVISAVFAQDGQ